jgi:hypothetical protein
VFGHKVRKGVDKMKEKMKFPIAAWNVLRHSTNLHTLIVTLNTARRNGNSCQKHERLFGDGISTRTQRQIKKRRIAMTKTMSIKARKYWINFFAKQAFDRRYAAYRGLDDHQRTLKLADHLKYFFSEW